MKARGFLAYLAIVAVSCSFAVSCDDNDNPPTSPQEPNYNDTIIYIDERTDDENITLMETISLNLMKNLLMVIVS